MSGGAGFKLRLVRPQGPSRFLSIEVWGFFLFSPCSSFETVEEDLVYDVLLSSSIISDL